MGCTTVVRPDTDVVMLRDCPFCMGIHRSPYADVLEAEVMECREKVSPTLRGSLDAWGERETIPVPPEVEAYTLHG